jgi:hypothetical protein
MITTSASGRSDDIREAKQVDFWTGDDSCVMWANPPTGSWVTVDEKFILRVRQTIRVTKSWLTVFFKPRAFVIVHMLPQGTSFTAGYLVDN